MVPQADPGFEMTAAKPVYFRGLILLLVLSLGPQLGGQESSSDTSQLSHSETIARALSDLESSNVDTRVGSIMLLGKYEDPFALNGVVRGLSDPHVRVRRAALVSLIEIQSAMPPQAVEKIMLLLNDDDGEIRRMVSSSLAMLVNLWNSYNRGNQLIPIPPALPLPVRQRFINAFLDEDVVVRRNMLSYYFFLGIQLPETILGSLLEDEDDQVRLEALRLCVRITRYATVLQQAEKLVVDPVQSIRLLFANMLGSNRNLDAGPWLEKLLEDSDEEVVSEAELSIFRIRPRIEDAHRLMESVLTGRFNQEQGTTFIKTLSILGNSAKGLIDQLLQSDNPNYRLEALRLFLGYADVDRDQKGILDLAQDKSEGVRIQVLNYLRSQREPLPAKLIEGLAYARDSKVRETALSLTRRFDDDDAEPLLFDFLIDEEPRLRMMALDELVRRDLPEVRETLHLSLEDSDWLIQRRAVTHLIGLNDPEELNFLKALVEKDPQQPLALYIKDQMLKRLGVQL
jgi:HEAT repeat protein